MILLELVGYFTLPCLIPLVLLILVSIGIAWLGAFMWSLRKPTRYKDIGAKWMWLITTTIILLVVYMTEIIENIK